MFVGQYQQKLDAKKRIVVPARMRRAFSRKEQEREVFATLGGVGESRCVELYPPTEWEKKVETLARTAEENEEAELFFRKFSWDAEVCPVDSQWRLMVPPRLVEAARLERDIVITGMSGRIEVWDLETWQKLDERLGAQSASLKKWTYQKKP